MILLACKLIKKLSESSEVYEDDEEEEVETRSRSEKKGRSRYSY